MSPYISQNIPDITYRPPIEDIFRNFAWNWSTLAPVLFLLYGVLIGFFYLNLVKRGLVGHGDFGNWVRSLRFSNRFRKPSIKVPKVPKKIEVPKIDIKKPIDTPSTNPIRGYNPTGYNPNGVDLKPIRRTKHTNKSKKRR